MAAQLTYSRRSLRSLACWTLAVFLCLCALPGTLTAANVIRGPYVQNSTPTSIVVCWRTDVATNSRVSVGFTAGTLTTQVNDAAQVTDHEITVSGLTANTRYYYAIGTSTGVLVGGTVNHTFLTNPAPGVGKPTRIWAIGDAGTGDANQAAVRDAYYAYAGPRNTDVWLMLGDNAYQNGADDEYQAHVFDVYQSLMQKSVVWPTRGNHEATANTAVYYGSFVMPKSGEAGGLASGSEAYYSFNYGRIHFICLDSAVTSRAAGDPMMTWLGNDLAANTMDWTIAFWHHPPYSKGTHDSDADATMTDMRTIALPVLEAGGVDLVLCGHSHDYERSFFIDGHYGLSTTFTNAMKVMAGDGKVGGNGPYEKSAMSPLSHAGAVYVVAGSSGKVAGGSLDHPAMYYSAMSLGSFAIDINGNQLDGVFLDQNGAILDNFRILKGSSGVDSTAPQLVAAGATDLTHVDLVFSERMAAAGANVPANYTLNGPSGAVTISAAALQANGETVRLTVPSMVAGGLYVVAANANVKDLANNGVAPGPTVTFVAPGGAGPAITGQPADAAVAVGATATFTVTAPTATNFQWKKNGVDIVGATSPTYTTPAATALDNGTQFTVVVSNATGSTLSTIATLTIATGGAPLTVVLQDGTSGYSGTRDTYLNAIAPNDTVSFGTSDRLNINYGGGGATENTVGLLSFDLTSVPTSATITSAKIDLWMTRTNGVDGADVLVLEKVTGNWTESSTWAGGVPAVVASGVSTPSLAGVPNASPLSPEYQYTITGIETLVQGWVATPGSNKGIKLSCTSSINLRFATREHATAGIRPRLTVTYTTGSGTPPTITAQPANVTVTAPTTATFSVVASGATSYQWQKNGVNIAGATASSYTTPATTTADSGALFRVLVTNASGTTTSNNATLTVNPAAGTPPSITTQPSNVTVTAPSTATFTVVATDATSYQWQKNGANIAGATASSYTTPATTTADSGAVFRVLVSNASGTTTSNNATLTVNPAVGTPPTITTQPANKTVTAPASATFTVVATGATSYQWQKNGVNIAGATASSYTTPATTTADSGAVFRVLVSNASGTTTSNNATLTVNPAVGGSNPITTSTGTVTISAPTGSTTVVTTTLILTNTSGTPITVTASDSAVWLVTGGPVVVPAGGTATLTVTANPAGLNGTQTATLTLTNSTGETQTMPVQFTIGTQAGLRKRACSVSNQSDGSPALLALALMGGCLLMRRRGVGV